MICELPCDLGLAYERTIGGDSFFFWLIIQANPSFLVCKCFFLQHFFEKVSFSGQHNFEAVIFLFQGFHRLPDKGHGLVRLAMMECLDVFLGKQPCGLDGWVYISGLKTKPICRHLLYWVFMG